MVGRIAVFTYGAVAYTLALVTLLYAIGFVGNFIVPRTIDSGVDSGTGAAIVINAILLGLFAVQHSVMARPAFKKRWTKIVPKPIERSTYVLFTCIILGALYWQWRPMKGVIWDVDTAPARAVITAIYLLGWAIVFYGSFLIDHFDLFGLRQVVVNLKGSEYKHPPFKMTSLYKLIRHPLMFGLILAFWAAPTMTVGHLMFAVMCTAYILVGINLEERDLCRFLGEDYRRYRSETPMLVPYKWR